MKSVLVALLLLAGVAQAEMACEHEAVTITAKTWGGLKRQLQGLAHVDIIGEMLPAGCEEWRLLSLRVGKRHREREVFKLDLIAPSVTTATTTTTTTTLLVGSPSGAFDEETPDDPPDEWEVQVKAMGSCPAIAGYWVWCSSGVKVGDPFPVRTLSRCRYGQAGLNPFDRPAVFSSYLSYSRYDYQRLAPGEAIGPTTDDAGVLHWPACQASEYVIDGFQFGWGDVGYTYPATGVIGEYP